MRLVTFCLIAAVFSPSLSFAFFCPTNFNQISYGMTIDQVTQICGKPNSTKESVKVDDSNVPQEWSYYIPQTVSVNSFQQAQGTLKTSVTFDRDGKAVNISVNGIGVGASTICGTQVQLGDSRDTIKSACGDPAFINKQSGSTANPPKEIKRVEFSYNSNPPAVLVFENGRLVEK